MQILSIRAVTEEQAKRLRAGEIGSDDLVESTTTAPGTQIFSEVGCAVAILTTFLAGTYFGSQFGWLAFAAAIVGGSFLTFAMMWLEQFLNSRYGGAPKSIDPGLVISKDRFFESREWDALHFVLTGETFQQTSATAARSGWQPLQFLLGGGEDLTSGHVEECDNLTSHADVVRIADGLRQTSVETTLSRIQSISRELFEDPADPANLKVLQADFDRLKTFVEQSANSGHSLLMTIL